MNDKESINELIEHWIHIALLKKMNMFCRV
jgi:hypothetical protein